MSFRRAVQGAVIAGVGTWIVGILGHVLDRDFPAQRTGDGQGEYWAWWYLPLATTWLLFTLFGVIRGTFEQDL